MRTHARIFSAVAGAVGALLLAAGVVYLTVACEDLPGILGPTPGDTSPRTPLGVVVLVAGLIVVAGAIRVARRRPPSSPAKP